MPRDHTCPTCATVLDPLRAVHLRRCNACNRQNPHQFNYCGFCASPLENTQIRAKLAEIAAPPGGWPSLTAELVELRFFVEQGQLDDAFELLSILQKRHPGHPALSDFARRAEPGKSDIEVGELVESLLASSADLAGKALRRAAPKWEAPQVVGVMRTSAHPAVPAQEPSSARAAREPTSVYRAATPEPPPIRAAASCSHTVVVDVLQPAAPFVGGEDDEVAPAEQLGPIVERMRASVAAEETLAADEPGPESLQKRPRRGRSKSPRRSSAFGQHVLSRLGG